MTKRGCSWIDLRRVFVALGVVWMLASSLTVSAHHSAAIFDATKTRTLNGTVVAFRWVNPHGYITLAVKTRSGNVQNWQIELQGVGGMRRMGLTRETFKPGDELSVVVHPLRDGTVGGLFVSATLPNGQSFAEKSP